MSYIDITTKTHETYSSISNFFIDYYMTSASGEFVKVYLYLVRLMSSKKPVSFPDIADHFNLTEKDICRAIKYWIKQDVICLEYNDKKELTGIILLPLEDRSEQSHGEDVDVLSLFDNVDSDYDKPVGKDAEAAEDAKDEVPAEATHSVPQKSHLSAQLLKKKQEDAILSELIFETEVYFGRALTAPEVESLIYIYDQLGFSQELIEHLIEYCIDKGHQSLRYAEKVASSWYEKNITTVDMAKAESASFNPFYKKVLRELGISRQVPTNIETAYIEAWSHEMNFSEELILLACRKAVMSRPQSANFSYVNGILENWHKNGVKSTSDVDRLDREFHSRKSASKEKSRSANPNGFGGFSQKDSASELTKLQELIEDELNKTVS